LVPLICLSCISGGVAQEERPSNGAVQAHREPKNHDHALVAIPHPDLSRMDANIQQQLRDAQSQLSSAIASRGVAARDLGKAYGYLGRLYQAYELWDSALACFLNAENSDHDGFDWPYYIGYLYQRRGDLNKARAFFGRALETRPNDPVALLRLAQVNLDLKHPEAARPLFQKALAMNKSSAALVGLGHVALSEQNFAEAVNNFQAALALDPGASGLHYQLALAYRALGDFAKAEASLEKRGLGQPKISDPLIDDLQNLRTGFGNLWNRGTRALAAGRVAEAVDVFRRMVEISPNDPNTRMYLGIGLARAGFPDPAMEQFTEALRIEPNHAGVHYNLGLLLAQRGLEQQATEHFRTVTKSSPDLKDGHFQLANLLMRADHYDEARQEYGIVRSMDPQNGFVRFMEAMALVSLKEYNRARSQLEQSLSALPDDTDIANALARLLAACPDKAIRDGPRGLKLAERVFRAERDIDSGETMAMALAEVGRYDEAADLQRAMISQLDARGDSQWAQSLRSNLVAYQNHKACRTPWRARDPVFKPVIAQQTLSAGESGH
jgi:tetratricopeptide (TPR) repeat protein